MNAAGERLTKYIDNNYVLLDWSASGKGKINKDSLKSVRRKGRFPGFLIAEDNLSYNQKFKIVENRRLDDID